LQQTTVLNNIWSNSQAVEDYKDYLDGKEIVVTKDGDAVIVVGKSERERNLAKCFAKLNPRGLDATLELGEKIPLEHPRVPGLTDFPVYMCVSASELAAAIDESCPDEKRDDLVFLSDGFLEPILKARGLCRKENTQATLWVSVGDKGKMYDERTSMGPNGAGVTEWCGESLCTGKWAGALVERLESGEVYCKELFYRDWRRYMLERTAYLAIFNLVGALHPEKTKGGEGLTGKLATHQTVANYYHEEVDDMLTEVSYTLRGYMAVTLIYGTTKRLVAYAEANGRDYDCVVKTEDYPFFNGLLWENAMIARERGFPDTCAMHTEYSEFGASKGLFELPPPKAGGPPQKIRANPPSS